MGHEDSSRESRRLLYDLGIVMDRIDELRLIEEYPEDKVEKCPPVFCAPSVQSELSDEKRDFDLVHQRYDIRKRWKYPRGARAKSR
jgi:hypothetical protein